MPSTLISIDLRRPPENHRPRPHNRWHPDIPAVTVVDPGTVFRMECFDATGGQILNSDSADDVRELDLSQLLYASGPIGVAGARPGDVLVVDILDIGPLPGAEWGYTALLDRSSGVGLLAEEFPEARKAIWDLNGVFATSRHIEGVRLAASPHPGLIGCAPSAEMLARWSEGERAAAPTAPEGLLRWADSSPGMGALVGEVPNPALERIVRDAARTWAARENGGSMDVKDLTPGSRAFLPVFVPGANLSVGDLQFSQGDGRISGFGGIRMSGWIDLHVDLVPDGMSRYRITDPVFERQLATTGTCDAVTFQGISGQRGGGRPEGDIWAAYVRAYGSAIRHLQRFGYAGEQIYALLAAAPIQGRISSVRGQPSVCCTVTVPAGIFDFEVGPTSDDRSVPRGELARPS